jgi:hypothetical protein
MKTFVGPLSATLGFIRSLAQRERAIQWDEMLNKVPDNHGLQWSVAAIRPGVRH